MKKKKMQKIIGVNEIEIKKTSQPKNLEITYLLSI